MFAFEKPPSSIDSAAQQEAGQTPDSLSELAPSLLSKRLLYLDILGVDSEVRGIEKISDEALRKLALETAAKLASGRNPIAMSDEAWAEHVLRRTLVPSVICMIELKKGVQTNELRGLFLF